MADEVTPNADYGAESELRPGQWRDPLGWVHDDRFPDRSWVICPDDGGSWCATRGCTPTLCLAQIDGSVSDG